MAATYEDGPKLFRNQAAVEARKRQLYEPHIQPLTVYVERLRARFVDRDIPFFDPWDGGVNAQCLFLLEAPGRNAVASGFISRNNDDETAKNFFELNREAGLTRKITATWNIVPWYIGAETKIRAAKKTDITEGLSHFGQVLELFPKLRAVVLLGKKAEQAEMFLSQRAPKLKIFRSLHPSPLAINRWPGDRDQLVEALVDVAEFLSEDRKDG